MGLIQGIARVSRALVGVLADQIERAAKRPLEFGVRGPNAIGGMPLAATGTVALRIPL